MSKLGSRHIPGLIILMILLGLVLPPFVNVGRYRAYIADSMSRALGRPVAFGNISLRLLPQPGFDFENFTVGDDPAFSAEPILRAEEVTAYLRISSLWRGRMEIARLSFKYPSLNLVRRPETGDWNVESLLYRASRTPAAPTTSMRPQSRPRFPYIDSTDGRINFKFGLEKKVFAFTEAKFEVWSPNENEWRIRLQAKPVRTDLVVADTGLVRAEGSLLRADELRNTQLNLTLAVERSQLGQLTRLIYGRDRGWRGALDLDAQLTGTPADLKFVTNASLQNFRRYDIMRGETLQFQAHCTGRLSSVEQAIDSLKCTLPADSGTITMNGSLHGWKADSFIVSFDTEKLPMNWVTAVARHAKRDLPDDLTASGTITGGLTLQKSADFPGLVLYGSLLTNSLTLRSALLGPDLPLGEIYLAAAGDPQRTKSKRPRVPTLEIKAFPVPLGAPIPASTSGWISRDGYSFSLQGDGDIARILKIARAVGVGAPKFQLKGTARLNAELQGEWKGFVQSDATGTMQVRNLVAEVPGISSPVKIASADVLLQQNQVLMRKLIANVDTLKATGSAIFPRHCEDEQPCVSHIDMQVDDLDLDEVNRLLNPRLKKRPWYHMFGVSGERSVLATWEADGTLEARHLAAKTLSANKLSLSFQLHKSKLELKDVRADIFGGSHGGDWTADFSGDVPTYSGTGTVSKVAVAQVASLMKDTWGSGTLNGSYDLKFAGWDINDLLTSAKGTCQFQWSDGTLKHLALDGKTPQVRFPQWTGQCEWSRDGFRVSGSKMQAASGIYVISGTVQPSKDLQLEFVRADGTAYQVTGTLEKPHVAAAPASRTTEAALHP